MNLYSLQRTLGPEEERMEEHVEPVGALEYAALFSAVFGESSDTDEDSNDQYCKEVGGESDDGYLWEKVKGVEGLWHCSNFLSLKQQESLMEAIHSEGWFCDPLHNQAMRFGDLPGWAKDLSNLIQSRSGGQSRVEALEPQESPNEGRDSTTPFPARILGREPLFDQMIVNLYQPGEGIAAHVDLLRFEDGIAIVSLESSCVMSFRIVNNPSDGAGDTRTREPILGLRHDSSAGYGNHVDGLNIKGIPHFRPVSCEHLEASGANTQAIGSKSQSHTSERDPSSGVAKKVDVLLNPGDLITAYGPARYYWTHEINRSNGNQFWHGQPIVQRRRVSVTLRRLCSQNDVQ